MASATHDDGFHEIQLNGKQLVFLFMVVTVVSIVIFLCGVLVGRGVRLDRGAAAQAPDVAAEPAPPPADVPANSSQPMATGEPTTFAPRLESATPPAERLPTADAPPAKAEPVAEAAPPLVPGARAAAPAPKSADASPSFAEPPGPGVAVQVSAYRVRQEAEALAARLTAKGYSAYVVPPAPGAPALFRVRVGKFADQGEASRVAARLKKEEQFDPWIVR